MRFQVQGFKNLKPSHPRLRKRLLTNLSLGLCLPYPKAEPVLSVACAILNPRMRVAQATFSPPPSGTLEGLSFNTSSSRSCKDNLIFMKNPMLKHYDSSFFILHSLSPLRNENFRRVWEKFLLGRVEKFGRRYALWGKQGKQLFCARITL